MRKEFKRVSVAEFEAMNKQDDPQIEFPSGRGWMVVDDPDVNGVVIVRAESGEYRRVNKDVIRPIQTPADKYREERIESMRRVIFRGNGFALHSQKERRIAEEAYDKGVRILAPDEFVVKRLTGAEMKIIAESWDGVSRAELIDAVQNAMLGEEK